jgi:Protein of unknown function (DUF3107)
VEVKIGVQNAARELVLDSEQSPDEVLAAVTAALASGDVLQLEDDRGRRVLVPVASLAYVEVGPPESRRIGFGSL